MRKEGDYKIGRRSTFMEERRELIREMYLEEGATDEEIAETAGVSRSLISRQRRGMGITSRPRPRTNVRRRDRMEVALFTAEKLGRGFSEFELQELIDEYERRVDG